MNQHHIQAQRRMAIYEQHREELEAMPKRTAGRWLSMNYPREFGNLEAGRDFIRNGRAVLFFHEAADVITIEDVTI